MPFIPFPNVPDVPGVPALPRLPSAAGAGFGSVSALAQALVLRMFQVEAKWGIFDASGRSLGDPSLFGAFANNLLETVGIGVSVSTNTFEFSKEMRISDFPVERGTFANYNKVGLPATPIVTLVYGGNEDDRKEFLQQIADACDSTDFYSVVTPEVTYVNYSVQSYDYERRHDKGATLLIVRITLKQIREVSAQYTQAPTEIKNPVSANAAAIVDAGKVQAKTPDVSTLKAFSLQIQRIF